MLFPLRMGGRDRLVAALFASALFPGMAVCQSPSSEASPTLNLRNTDTITLNNQPNDPIIGIVQCDQRGNIYFRTYQYPEPLAAPVVKITPDKTRSVTAPLGQTAEFNGRQFQILDFHVDQRGQVWALIPSRKDDDVTLSVVVFDEDGKFKSQIKLQSKLFNPAELVPLPSGQFLVTGFTQSASDKSATPPRGIPPTAEPFTAIFDASGRVVKELNLPGDIENSGAPAKTSPQSAPQPDSPKSKLDARSAVMETGTTTGDDGNIYVMRKTNPPTVYVVSETGDLIRHFQVEKPTEAASPLFMRFVSNHRLLFDFVEPVPANAPGGDTQIFTVVSADSGETLYRYKVSGASGGAFACYKPDQTFTFLNSTPAGFMTIVKSVAQ